MKIKILRNVAASGTSLSEGQVVEAPGDISESDAAMLINLRAASLVPPKSLTESGEQDAPGTASGTKEKSDLSKKRNHKK